MKNCYNASKPHTPVSFAGPSHEIPQHEATLEVEPLGKCNPVHSKSKRKVVHNLTGGAELQI